LKSVSRGRRAQKRVVERVEKRRAIGERRGEEKRKKKKEKEKRAFSFYLLGMIWFAY
jgi:hypothetical protein